MVVTPSKPAEKAKKNAEYYRDYYYPEEDGLAYHDVEESDDDDFFNAAVAKDAKKSKPTVLKKQKKQDKQYGAPLRRPEDRSPYVPRSHRQNETPMYTRPFLEDPIYLQPDDYEVEMLHHSIDYLN